MLMSLLHSTTKQCLDSGGLKGGPLLLMDVVEDGKWTGTRRTESERVGFKNTTQNAHGISYRTAEPRPPSRRQSGWKRSTFGVCVELVRTDGGREELVCRVELKGTYNEFVKGVSELQSKHNVLLTQPSSLVAQQKLCEWIGWANCTNRAKDRATGLQSLRLWVQAMRFDASIN
ncbi:hypothetical protein SRHO_G00296820 [Serrasalmus rhombeus]